MILGLGITGKSELPGNPVLLCEYHQCDRCHIEFKLYFKAHGDLDEALEQFAKKMGQNGHEDLCFACRNPVPAEQLIIPFEIK